MNRTLEEAFGELIKKRKWYNNSLRSSIQAKNDKAKFLNGKKVPEEQIRDYLSAAGWVCLQTELWGPTGITLKEAFSELIKKRKWYKTSICSYSQALNDKAKFLKNEEVPEKRIREYLLAAKYIILQKELWEKKY